jgi:hypothetical protein
MKLPMRKQFTGVLLSLIALACNGNHQTLPKKTPVQVNAVTVAAQNKTVKASKADTIFHTDVLEFIDLDANGDNELLIAHRAKDTIQYICEQVYQGKFNRGDVISIKWRTGTYINPGDPETTIQSDFVVSYKLLKPGQLSLAKQKRFPRLAPYYYSNSVSDYAKSRIEEEVRYFLATTNQPELKKLMDRPTKEIAFTVKERTIDGRALQEIWFTTSANKPQPIYNVFYDHQNPYQLFEGDKLKPKY